MNTSDNEGVGTLESQRGMPSIKELVVASCEETPQPLDVAYSFVRAWRGQEIAEETIRARMYEALKEGKIIRVARGVYFARSGTAQLVLFEGDAWEAMPKVADNSVDCIITDHPFKLGTDAWVGMGTTRPHAKMGERTYAQRDIDEEWLRNAFRILRKDKAWNTINKERKLAGDWPVGGGACLLPGSRLWYWPRPEKVGTPNPMQVFSQAAKPQSVVAHDWLQYDGEAYVVKPRLLQEYRVTAEHPFYVVRLSKKHYPLSHYQKKVVWEGWVRADHLKQDDCLVLPRFPDGTPQRIHLSPKNPLRTSGVKRPTDVSLNEDLAYFLGWFGAEGYAGTDGNIVLTLNSSKDPVAEIAALIRRLTYSPYTKRTRGKTIELGFKSHLLSRWLRSNVGTSARTKRIPKELFLSPNTVKLSFIRGYMLGDGYNQKRRQGIGTASEDMWYDLTYLLVQLGIVPSTSISHNRSHELDGRIIKESICYTITVSGKQQLKLGIHVNPSRRSAPSYIERDERILIPIRRISRLHYKGPIYTPETEDHTYLMPVVTHNCALFVPSLTRTTWPHVRKLIDLAESVGFVFYGSVTWDKVNMGMGYHSGRDQKMEVLVFTAGEILLFTAGERNGVLWDLSMPNVLSEKKLKRKCAPDAVEHEAEKPAALWLTMADALTREGDVVADFHVGRGRWIKQMLEMGRHVIAGDIDGTWPDRLATEDFGFVGAS